MPRFPRPGLPRGLAGNPSARTPKVMIRPDAGPASGDTIKGANVIILGAVLLVIGFIAGISILWTIGIVLIVAGAVLAVLGGTGRRIAGRAHWY